MQHFIHHLLRFSCLFAVVSSCSWLDPSDPVDDLFSNPPDTSNLLPLPTSTTAAYRQELIRKEQYLADGKQRQTGNVATPKDGDDFRFQNLDGIRWENAQVRRGDFRGVSFRTALADGSIFTGSDFRLADLRWSSFDESRMDHCDLSQSVLFRTSVNDACLDSADFRGANMFGVKGHRSSFINADFSNALMKESELMDSNFSHSKAIKVKFIITVFSGSRFDSADYSYSDFTGAGLETCSFVHARLHEVSFKGAHLQEADFSGADLLGADFYAAELAETNFAGAKNIPADLLPFINEEGLATGIVFSKNGGH